MEQTSVPVPDVSVTEVALEEEAMERVSSFAAGFLLKLVDGGGNALFGRFVCVVDFVFSFTAFFFAFSFFFLLQKNGKITIS